MGYFQVRYDSRVVNYDCRGFLRLATVHKVQEQIISSREHSHTYFVTARFRRFGFSSFAEHK